MRCARIFWSRQGFDCLYLKTTASSLCCFIIFLVDVLHNVCSVLGRRNWSSSYEVQTYIDIHKRNCPEIDVYLLKPLSCSLTKNSSMLEIRQSF